MILKELQGFLRERKKVSIQDIKFHFRMDGNALRAMLDKLIRKGRVCRIEFTKKCAGCGCCDSETMELYEWVC